MHCCQAPFCDGTNRFFSRWSKYYAKNYRKKGLEKIQKYLLEGVRKGENTGGHILDIGCGVGALHLTLLKERSEATATGIEISEGMLEMAKSISREQGLEERTQYFLGDFVQQAHNIDEADITLLDKVVCCYEDLNSLLEASIEKTRSTYGLTHPKNNLLIKIFFNVYIFFSKLFRASFSPFWYDWAQMHEQIIAQGFQPIYQNSTFLWQVVVFKRIEER